jgi:predicted dithiol-disulfide oxidoreductase (DUF899 family)
VNPHQIVAKAEWIEARRAVLSKEKELKAQGKGLIVRGLVLAVS